MKVPSMMQAELLLNEAESKNPGPWTGHSRVAGECAKAIALHCPSLDYETAYTMGLLHDIGRRFGVTDLRHTLDGYRFMAQQGFDDCARICLTHSFPFKEIASYNGKNDCSKDETEFIRDFITQTEYNDYDRLIQLCDALAYPTGAVYMEKRLVDVVFRRGFNDLTVVKWKAFFHLKEYFDELTGCDLYSFLLPH